MRSYSRCFIQDLVPRKQSLARQVAGFDHRDSVCGAIPFSAQRVRSQNFRGGSRGLTHGSARNVEVLRQAIELRAEPDDYVFKNSLGHPIDKRELLQDLLRRATRVRNQAPRSVCDQRHVRIGRPDQGREPDLAFRADRSYGRAPCERITGGSFTRAKPTRWSSRRSTPTG